ncbi:RdgB/HAM1 family non-canonical purine NTP pyrophosphatase [soil metagenome]
MPLSLPAGTRLVAATHNPGKAREISALLDGRFDVVSADALRLPEPEEPETTYGGNALLKARKAADRSGLIALADDSGFCVGALGGAPGVLSARWAGEPRDFGFAMARVAREVDASGSDDTTAAFICALAVAWPNGPAVVVQAQVDGALTFPRRGTRGFGYDPIFTPQGETETFGEMDPERKAAMSHRTLAFARLREALF